IQAEYFFYLSVTDLNSGLAYWEDERTIDKTGSSKSVTW
ncbi:penicillin-binding protein activator LpoB, partial [Campylobacter coli]